uniref:Uncharacterized protein n=1 Tax=Megaselia scalaris TaxID=36166 RepID=T1GXR3_MEGSC
MILTSFDREGEDVENESSFENIFFNYFIRKMVDEKDYYHSTILFINIGILLYELAKKNLILEYTPPFKGSGFDDWQFRVKMYMKSSNLLAALTEDEPAEVNAKTEFNKMNDKAMNRLVSFVHNDCLCHTREKETA